MVKRVKLYDGRRRYGCFICEKLIQKNQVRFMVALDGWYKPINLWIHRKCYDRSKIEEILKDDEKRPRIINFKV